MARLEGMPKVKYILHCAREGCSRIVTRESPWWTLRAECEGECGVVSASTA